MAKKEFNPAEDTLWARCFNKCFLDALENDEEEVSFSRVDQLVLEMSRKPVLPMLMEMGLVQAPPPAQKQDGEGQPEDDDNHPA